MEWCSQIYFKMDATQKTSSFKIRGVLNNLLALKKVIKYLIKLFAYSTGNHASCYGLYAKFIWNSCKSIFTTKCFLLSKRIAKYYGAEVMEVKPVPEARIFPKDGRTDFIIPILLTMTKQ